MEKSLIHPGEILSEEYLKPMGLTPGAVAKRLHVPRMRLYRLIEGQAHIDADNGPALGKILRHDA